MEAIKTYELPNNRTLKVFQDDSTSSPRGWDNLSKMIFIGRHSHLGDNHDFHNSHESFEAHQADIEKQLDIAIILPVYAYIHSGMTISLSPFSCRWDSGKLGWVVVTKQAIRENWNIKNVTKKYVEMAMNIVDGEIETLDQYIRGDVYGFQVCDENDNVEDSCWGFYGDDIKENGILDNLSKEDIEFINQVELV
jgi:hypothetical protein